MKIIALLARLLLGLVFFVFGVNGFLHFIPGPIPPGIAGQYVMALFQSHYYVVIFGAQFLGGVLLLVNRYVPLALTILGPVIVNILCFHLFMLTTGLPLALIVAVLWAFLVYRDRQAFSGLFVQRTS
jgi:putative oxidoreductase